MKVGINGMGRIGRLALRAALGGAHRGKDDPYKNNRLDVVHVNEIKGGAALVGSAVLLSICWLLTLQLPKFRLKH